MKIGFFGGSFNPISNIHMKLAKMLTEKNIVDKVFFVPVGDYYKKTSLIKAEHRINMIKLAISNEEKIEIEDISAKSEIELCALDTFKLIEEKYRDDDLFFIMGSDNYRKISTWKNYEEIINKYNLIIIERERKKIRKTDKNNIIEIIPENFQTIDSTIMRNMVKENKDISKYINKDVYNYIKVNGLYENEE